MTYVSTSERFEYTENHIGNWAGCGGTTHRRETNPVDRILGNYALPVANGNFRRNGRITKNFRDSRTIYICAWKAKGSRVREKRKKKASETTFFLESYQKERKKREEAFSFLFKGGQRDTWKRIEPPLTGGWLIRGGGGRAVECEKAIENSRDTLQEHCSRFEHYARRLAA